MQRNACLQEPFPLGCPQVPGPAKHGVGWSVPSSCFAPRSSRTVDWTASFSGRGRGQGLPLEHRGLHPCCPGVGPWAQTRAPWGWRVSGVKRLDVHAEVFALLYCGPASPVSSGVVRGEEASPFRRGPSSLTFVSPARPGPSAQRSLACHLSTVRPRGDTF